MSYLDSREFQLDLALIKQQNRLILTQTSRNEEILRSIQGMMEIVVNSLSNFGEDIQMKLDDFMTALTGKLSAMESQEDALIALVVDLRAQLQANINDPVAMQAILDRVDTDKNKLIQAALSTPVSSDTVTGATGNDSVATGTDTVTGGTGNSTIATGTETTTEH